jgi:murein DD-endopeptidase MepM/ murein hydrolase activator NlpD
MRATTWSELMLRGAMIVLAAALCATSAVAGQPPHGAIVLPVSSCISSPFGPRVLPNYPQAGTYHNGVDLPAPEGTPVRAVASGKLLRISEGGPGGLEVLIQHDGFVSVYSHLAMASPTLGKGMITAGEEVGIVGHTGVSIGAHLFFGLLQAGRAVDPAPFLGAPLCNGVARQQTPAQILAAGGKLPPTRRYYLLSDFPASRS